MSQGKRKRILVVEDDQVLSEMLRLIFREEGYEVSHASSGEEAYEKAIRQVPDLAIIDVILPAMDGYMLTRRLRQRPLTRSVPIMMLSSKSEIADKVAGFQAGADDYLTKPFQHEELIYRAKNLIMRAELGTGPLAPIARRRGKIIAVFGSKGGVGKTVVATNLAVAIRQRTNKRVVIFETDFFFGDLNVHLNLPAERSIIHFVQNIDQLEPTLADQVLTVHQSGVRVLLSPSGPEQAEMITADHIKHLLEFLVELCDYLVVDCNASYDDRMLAVLERADHILIVVTPEIGPLKNTIAFFEIADKLGLSVEKTQIVLNRANSNVGIEDTDIERTLSRPVAFRLNSGGTPVVLSVNRGVPIVMDRPEHPLSQQIMQLADSLIGVRVESKAATKDSSKNTFPTH